jgi:hypothetical protein
MGRSLLSVVLLVIGLTVAACSSGSMTFSIGGTVSGLNGGSLVLQINGGETVSVTADGVFQFPTKLPAGAPYAVTVQSAPIGTTASISGGAGTVGGTVTTVAVAVADAAYTVGGSIHGLHGTIVLENSNGEQITLTADGPFTFPTALAHGAPFAITIASAPAGQLCTVDSLRSGTVNGANVTDIGVICLDHFAVGGTISGLSGSVTLRNNGTDELALTQNGAFQFAAPVIDGRSFEVEIVAGATTQRYTLAGASGTVNGAAVTSIEVDCTDRTWVDPLALGDDKSPDGSGIVGLVSAMGRNGDIVLAWSQFDGAFQQVFMAECRNGIWTNPQSLSDNISPDGTNAISPSIAVGDGGDTIIAWLQSDGSDNRVMVSQYRDGNWTHPLSTSEAISLPGSAAGNPCVAMGTDGEGLVLWGQLDSGNRALLASQYRHGVWTHPDSIEDAISPAGADIVDCSVGIADNGDAIVVGRHLDSLAGGRLLLIQRTNGGWNRPASVNEFFSLASSDAFDVAVAMAPNGDAVVTWTQSDGSDLRTFFSQRLGGTWMHPASSADAISFAGSGSFLPDAAIAPNGDAAITWTQTDGSNLQVFCSHFENGTWTHPANNAANLSPDGWDSAQARVAIAANGDLVIAWRQSNATTINVARAERRNGVWSLPADENDTIGPDADGAWEVEVHTAPLGEATIVWALLSGAEQFPYTSEFR